MSDFGDRLARMVAKDMYQSVNNAEAMADIVEHLARSLGFSIALMAKGEGGVIDTLMQGAESYAHEEAVHKAPIARTMSKMAAASRPSPL